MEKSEQFALGMDIGGTNSVYGIVNREGEVVCCDSVKTKDFPIVDDYVKTVSDNIKKLISNNGLSINQIIGFGVGAPNANYYTGNIDFAPNLPWKGQVVPLGRMFEEQLGIPVILTNDAKAAALGEMIYGAAKGMKDFIMITLGTGIGSGIVVNGKLVYGHDGIAGELGHTIVRPNGRLCACGRRGCLEAYCSATGIANTAKERMRDTQDNSLLRNTPVEKITSKDIYDAAVQGDEVAIDIFRETGTMLGQALANFVLFSNPEAIVLFGGLAKSGDYILKYTREAMEDSQMELFKGKTKLIMSSLKESNAAVLGASALAWENAE